MNDFFQTSLDSSLSTFENVGTFRNNRIDRTCKFQHVIQRAYRRENLLVGDVPWYYRSLIESNCPAYRVLPICQVIMPNHVHEIYYTDNIDNISELRRIACCHSTVMMRKYRKKQNYSDIEHLFEPDPGYVAIKDSKQLLTTLKYIRDNDLFLKEKGDKAPYSCFEYWEKGYFKPYAVDSVSKLFDLTPEKLTELLSMSKDKVLEFADKYFTEEIQNRDRTIFLK